MAYKVYVFDMDGVLWNMDDPIPHASETVNRLLESGAGVYFLTNNSSKTRKDYVEKLARFSIATTEEFIYTSANAAARILASEGAAGKSIYVIGEHGLKWELANAGLRVVEFDESDKPDFVIVGWDRQFTYTKLAEAQRAILSGATFIATNRDLTYPGPAGRLLPGSGSLVAAVEACSGTKPRVIGKPEPTTLEMILEHARADTSECLVIGDRLDTDIAIGNRVGVDTALTLTGISSRAEALSAPPEQRPTYIVNDLSELPG